VGSEFWEARPPITPDGAGDGIRTHDVLLGKVVVLQIICQ